MFAHIRMMMIGASGRPLAHFAHYDLLQSHHQFSTADACGFSPWSTGRFFATNRPYPWFGHA
jgi:hypothetical protein